MIDTISAFLKSRRRWMLTPPSEKLLEKYIGLDEQITRYDPAKLDDRHKHTLKTCQHYMTIAKELLEAKVFSHPHLIWNLLHRVDEQVILLMEEHELSARVIDVKAAFDLSIKEEAVRKEWLGDKGKLVEAIKDIDSGGKVTDTSRYTVKEALQYLDDFVDYGFWKLSMNILMSVLSAALLALTTLGFFVYYRHHGGVIDTTRPSLELFAILGLMGGYLSNLLTREDFLFVWGGPFFRYLFYNLMARPVIGAFSAIFFVLVEKSKLIFSINPSGVTSGTPSLTPPLVTINVDATALQYVYIVFAITVGFAGEKALRGMMDTVLKRLEEKAEKTKETKPDAKK